MQARKLTPGRINASRWLILADMLSTLGDQDTYRYHGHSISDPGSTYRTRDEIAGVRRARDPVEHVRTLLLEHNFADAKELKQIERDVKKVTQQKYCATLSPDYGKGASA